MIGHTLDGRYVIRSRIARGGMAMVYLADDLRLERLVAVKVMHEHLAEDESFRKRFDQEARSAARLSHPNLVHVFDQGYDAGRNYLVMEYLPNITLRDLLKKQRSLTREQTLEIGSALLAGLAAAHRAGIVHRDLKPENVLLADDGRIKLGDFGLARAVSANTTTGQALLGTIAYLSPELVTRGIADARSDLYAFGIMLYEMLTGVQPFTGEQPMQIAYQHAHSDVPAPSLASTVSDEQLDAFVSWLTKREPEERPLDAGEALVHLQGIISGSDPVVPAATTKLPSLDATTVLPGVTPSTSVLNPAQSQLLAEPPRVEAAPPSVTPIDRAAAAARRRTKRGRIVAGITALAIVAAGGLGWWFGQGPGSQATVPEVNGLAIAEATAAIESAQLIAKVDKCASLEVPVGFAVSSDPGAGSRVDRDSVVQVCESSGPEMLTVPTIAGLSLDDAKAAIKAAKFTVGEVTDERFADSAKGVVIVALDADGEPLGETYPEAGVVNLILSAGPLPELAGKAEKTAIKAIEAAGLVVNSDERVEANSDDVAAGHVISVQYATDPVRPGDSVSLTVSLGPELFAVPEVEGMSLQEAMDALASAGFKPVTRVPDALREFAKATGTKPGAGEMLPAGAEVQVRSQLSL